MLITPGTRVGPYEIVSAIGAGGMGEVYRARDPHLKRDLAIKLLPADKASNPDQVRRFEQEARSASGLNHPSIVTIYDVGRVGDQPWIAMELVHGESLRHVLAQGQLPTRRALTIALRIAEGLAAAHEQGIVHRDLKPDNIMIGPDSRAKILDFGLAKVSNPLVKADDVTAQRDPITMPGTILGTYGYMSPEQASGKDADFRSDQFSFGLILYEMITAVRPFERETTVETLHAIIRESAPPAHQYNAEIPEALQWILDRLLCKEPAERYAATADLVRDLQRVQETSATMPSAAASRVRASDRRARRSVIFGGAAIVVIVLAVTAAMRFRTPVANGPERKVLAVLPFTDLSGDPRGELFARGIAETVSVRLGQLSGVQVMPPLAAAEVNMKKGVPAAARQLGATLLLHATVQRSGNDLRLNYSILDDRGVQVAANSVSGTTAETLALEDRLAADVLQRLELQIREGAKAPASGLASAADQSRYLEAIGLLQRNENEASVDSAIASLESLTRSSPRSGVSQAALGRAYLYKYALTSDPAWVERATEACRKALALDPGSPSVHVTLGELRIRTGDFEGAIAELRKALDVEPDSYEALLQLADAYARSGQSEQAERTYRQVIQINPTWWSAHNYLGAYFFHRGRSGEAIAEFRKVVELTPDNVRGHTNLGSAYLSTGQLDDALASFDRSIALRPNSDAYSNRATILYIKGQYRDAAAANERAIALGNGGDYQLWFNLAEARRQVPGEEKSARDAYLRTIELGNRSLATNERDPVLHAVVAVAHAKTGDPARAREHIQRGLALGPDDPQLLYFGAVVENASGDRNRTYEYLERARSAGYPAEQIASDPDFRNLSTDERFRRLVGSKRG